MISEGDIYQQIGDDGFARLVRAFYAQVSADDILGPMYPPDDLDGAEDRLRDFLVGRFGGPQRYVEQRGHPRLRMRHAPFPVGVAARDAWLANMRAALDTLHLPPAHDAPLWDYFTSAADSLRNLPG